MENYNLYLILNPNLSSEDVEVELAALNEVLTNNVKATNININQEGLNKLAYPIKKKQTGYYISVDFDIELEDCRNLKLLEQKLNLRDNVMRYLVINQTDYLKQKSKEKVSTSEIRSHRELNKGRKDNKQSILTHLGIRELNYKNAEFLSQFVSPYNKIFSRERTGLTASQQRKVAQAVKRARHMALVGFTDLYI